MERRPTLKNGRRRESNQALIVEGLKPKNAAASGTEKRFASFAMVECCKAGVAIQRQRKRFRNLNLKRGYWLKAERRDRRAETS
jgi:hypothetical protein